MKNSNTWIKQLKDKQNKKQYPRFYLYACGSGLCEPPKKWLFYPGTAWFIMVNPLRYIQSISNKYISNGEYNVYKKLGLNFPKYDNYHQWLYYNFSGESFNPNLSKYAYMYTVFESVVGWDKINTYCEIGSGYGGMVELLECNTDIKEYILIDFPEMLEIAKTYLKSYDNVRYVPISEYQSVDKVDMFLNSDSFVEMLPSTAKEYFEFMQKFKDVYLLSHNRIKRQESGYDTSEGLLPYDDKWNELYGKKVEVGNQSEYDVFVRISKR